MIASGSELMKHRMQDRMREATAARLGAAARAAARAKASPQRTPAPSAGRSRLMPWLSRVPRRRVVALG